MRPYEILLHLLHLDFKALSHHIIRISPERLPGDPLKTPHAPFSIFPVLISEYYVQKRHHHFHEGCNVLKVL